MTQTLWEQRSEIEALKRKYRENPTPELFAEISEKVDKYKERLLVIPKET